MSYYTVEHLLGEGTTEKVLATAAQIFINHNKLNEAVILLTSDLILEIEVDTYEDTIYAATTFMDSENERVYRFVACLQVPVELYSRLEPNHEVFQAIEKTIEAILPYPDSYQYRPFLISFRVIPKYINIEQDWRKELMMFIEEEKALNQATFIKNENQVFLWNGIRFASLPEMEVAKQLEKISNLLYIPNCLTRLVGESKRQLVPDFLVKYNGQWAILEIDGSQHNIPNQAENDKARDRAMMNFGLPTIRFPAKHCAEESECVVIEFLKTLKGMRN